MRVLHFWFVVASIHGSAIAQHGGAHAPMGHAQHGPLSMGAATPVATPTHSAAVEIPEPREFVSSHSIQVDGKTLRYDALAGETQVRADDGQVSASIFSVAYLKEELIADATQRPITFVFNGGPGSSAVWLHLGAFGPRRLDLGLDPMGAGAPPYRLVDNPFTLLTHSDLVFLDPVGTGYSRALGGHEDADFWGVDEDARAVASFIRTFLDEHDRWNSPRYLMGESYGGTRAALLIRELSLVNLGGMAFNGVLLISPGLNVRSFLDGDLDNQLPYVTHLPTFAATAHYHEALPKRPENLDAFLEEVRDFASTEYLTALFQGNRLPETEAAQVASKLAGYTGLSESYLRRSNLRISARRFVKELLRERGETLALHDTRIRGRDPDAAGENVLWDPFLGALDAPFVSSIRSYLGEDLGVDLPGDYTVFNVQAAIRWKRPMMLSMAFSGYLYTSGHLAEAAAGNDDFRVFVASGYHDLTTSFFGTEYTMQQSGIDPERVSLHNYIGGHMMYLRQDSLRELAGDLREFLGARS